MIDEEFAGEIEFDGRPTGDGRESDFKMIA
jgi:hypothetical protein